MINTLLCRGLPALALAALPLLTTSIPAAANTTAASQMPFTGHASGQGSAGAPGAAGVRAPLPLFEAIDRLPVAVEHREGYKRDLYQHWNKGLIASDGCDTRREVILAEAVVAPQVAAGCKLTGGYWRSPYDNLVVTDAGRLDVDHMVSVPATA
ncbi:hypothetical protein [Streptomyces sp. NPDC091371]|uniref:hypothetical protein n=1 Tax=Streptomyces sp. NPDC091371 TaxID=3155303 RepID=UPI00343B3900